MGPALALAAIGKFCPPFPPKAAIPRTRYAVSRHRASISGGATWTGLLLVPIFAADSKFWAAANEHCETSIGPAHPETAAPCRLVHPRWMWLASLAPRQRHPCRPNPQ